jgi:hypothetical protein
MISPLKTRYMSNAPPSFSQAMKSTEKVTLLTLSSFEGLCSNCPSSVIIANYNHLIHFQKNNTYIKALPKRAGFLARAENAEEFKIL